MTLLFGIATERLGELLAAGQYDGARTLLRELGEEALAENEDWVLLNRDRPLEIPEAKGARATAIFKALK